MAEHLGEQKINTTYRIVVRGVRPEKSVAEVAHALAPLFKVPPEQLTPLLQSSQFVVKRGVAIGDAAKYEQSLTHAGAIIVVEPEVAMPPEAPFVFGPLEDLGSGIVRSEKVGDQRIAGMKPFEKLYFTTRFNLFELTGGFKPTWNWAAFFLGVFWYFFKGLWAKGAMMIAIIVLLAGMPAIFFWIYAGIAGNYDYYLLKRRGTQLWSPTR